MHISTLILQLAVLSRAMVVLGLSVPGDPNLQQRTANPACLKPVELSCLNLAANCIDSVNSGNINNLWGIKSCVAAATCYGVGDLITSVECQTSITTTNAAQASLDYTNIYASIVGSCAWAPGGCPITQQNYIDFYYGELTAINSANYPSSVNVVIAFWNAITAWAATGSTVPYLNFNDWLHYSSYPSTTPTNGKYVFAHFILGVVASYVQSDWEADMNLAKAIGIDAFALNIGKDTYNDQQLGFAYAAAANVGFKVFISFDFAYWSSADVSTMATYIQTYATKPGQFIYNNAAFVSSFIGDGYPYRTLESQSGVPLFACPNWQPGSFVNNANADCGLSWSAAWPNTNNNPLDANITTSLDQQYINDLGSKPYMMPVSPWFNTHYGTDTYSKNWIFYSDWLYQSRWDEVLQLQPQFVEILTWNDFGESHYIGPLHGNNSPIYAGGPTGASRMPHDAWRDVAQIYISAFKSGASTPTVTTDELVYYYRPTPKSATCSDTIAPQPTGYQYDDDFVFVIALLKSAGTVTITSGSNAPMQFSLSAGVHTIAAPMSLGTQTFALSSSTANLSGNGGLQITNQCSVYNFNAYVGKVSA